MISLVPEWAKHLDEFWLAIKRRNRWLIKLRYLAVITLLGFILGSEFLLGFSYTKIQFYVFGSLTILILIYNIILHFLKDKIKSSPEGFNILHFSIVQMILDLIVLSLLIYFTGGIESPLLMLYLFHMIIGSLILPARIIFPTAALIVITTYVLSLLEYMGKINHYYIPGFLESPLFDNYKFILLQSLTFGFVVFASVFLANRIARELYKLEQQLVESFEKLEKAEQEKQKYIMAVVHEIKTPLTAVITFLSIITDKLLGPVSEKVEEKVKRAKVRAQESIDMINDVLWMSKLRLLNDLNIEEIGIDEIVITIIRKNNILFQQKKIKLKLDIISKHKNIVKGDRFYLSLAFSNVFNNAVKYTPEGGNIKVVIDSGEGKVRVDIIDSGVGIPAKDLPNIFNDFYRASNIKAAGIEGSGLGLSIVKSLIEKHNGTIEVVSPSELATEKYPGTKITITLPSL